MKKYWQLQDAKNHFSEVVDKAVNEGAQIVTKRGQETAVILSFEDYKKLTQSQGSLAEFFTQSPLKGVELDLERSRDLGRDTKL